MSTITRQESLMHESLLTTAETQTILTKGQDLKHLHYCKTSDYKARYDEHGAFLGHDEIDTGFKAKDIPNMDAGQKEFLRYICRPCSKEVIAAKLTELMFYRPVYGGDDGRAIVIAGVARELEGISVYGLCEAFNHFALKDEGKWFNAAAFCNKAIAECQHIREFLRQVENYKPPSQQIAKSAPAKEPPPIPYKDLPLEKQLETDATLIKVLGLTPERKIEFMDKINAMQENFTPTGVIGEVLDMINKKQSETT